MTVLIDEPRWWHRGRRWCHLVSDSSYDELHEFAHANGIPRRGFQGDHYDIPDEYRSPDDRRRRHGGREPRAGAPVACRGPAPVAGGAPSSSLARAPSARLGHRCGARHRQGDCRAARDEPRPRPLGPRRCGTGRGGRC
ncbi:MAG: DUF4031 domain-containing protein [Ilumatobacteraceae bacterium]